MKMLLAALAVACVALPATGAFAQPQPDRGTYDQRTTSQRTYDPQAPAQARGDHGSYAQPSGDRYGHRRHRVCRIRHHHRVCTWR